MVEDCLFCKIVKGEVPCDKLAESENFIVIRDAFPKLKGHSLIVSKRHFRDFMGMDRGLDSELLGLARDVVEKEGWEEFNLVVNDGRNAGQIIGHVHFHILPRRKDDGFKFGI